MNKTIAILVVLVGLLAGCHDGRQFNSRAAAELKEVEQVLDAHETRKGESYKGMGGALLHEMRYRSAEFRADKWYPVGDHYSVNVKPTAGGLRFSVARDH